MAKTESTAVNELIELVQTQKPLPADPSEDVLFREPPKPKVSVPRMTSTVPPLRGAGEVAPLPRTRAPQGTQQGVPAVMPPVPPVRMSTAPQRTATVPPLVPQHAVGVKRPSVPPPIPGSAPPPVPASAPPIPSAFASEPEDSMVATTQDLRSQLRDASPKSTLMGHGSPLPATLPSPRKLPEAARTTAPHMMPVAAPFSSRPAAPMPAPMLPPTAAPPVGALVYPPAAPYLQHISADMTSNQAWFDQAGPIEPLEPLIEHDIGTARVPKQSDWKALVPKLIAPTIGLIMIGVFVGGFFAFNGDGGYKGPPAKPATESAAKVVPAADTKAEPATAVKEEPKAEEPKAEEPKADAKEEPKAEVKADVKADDVKEEPKASVTPPNLVGTKDEPAVANSGTAFVDIRIDSKPSGATVMLVDRGKTNFLGTTPISTSVDPSRKYELVFTYTNKPTHIEKLDPSTTKKVAVVLGGKSAAPIPALKVEKKVEAPKVEKKVEAPKVEKKVEKKVEAPKKVEAKTEDTKVVDPFEKKAPAAEPVGEGVLMISSKPPCEIYIDGTPTGLLTPQRSIKLPAGKHKVTLVNTADKIKKTIAIQISPDQPTKVIQDLMK